MLLITLFMVDNNNSKSKLRTAAKVLAVAGFLGGTFYLASKDIRERSKTAQVQPSASIPEAAPTFSDKENELHDGVYRGQLNGRPIEYMVKSGFCSLRLMPGFVFDSGCNNTADSVATGHGEDYSREDLERTGKTVYFDQLLTAAQKLALPENKVPDTAKEDLDRMLAPYK